MEQRRSDALLGHYWQGSNMHAAVSEENLIVELHFVLNHFGLGIALLVDAIARRML